MRNTIKGHKGKTILLSSAVTGARLELNHRISSVEIYNSGPLKRRLSLLVLYDRGSIELSKCSAMQLRSKHILHSRQQQSSE